MHTITAYIRKLRTYFLQTRLTLPLNNFQSIHLPGALPIFYSPSKMFFFALLLPWLESWKLCFFCQVITSRAKTHMHTPTFSLIYTLLCLYNVPICCCESKSWSLSWCHSNYSFLLFFLCQPLSHAPPMIEFTSGLNTCLLEHALNPQPLNLSAELLLSEVFGTNN